MYQFLYSFFFIDTHFLRVRVVLDFFVKVDLHGKGTDNSFSSSSWNTYLGLKFWEMFSYVIKDHYWNT